MDAKDSQIQKMSSWIQDLSGANVFDGSKAIKGEIDSSHFKEDVERRFANLPLELELLKATRSPPLERSDPTKGIVLEVEKLKERADDLFQEFVQLRRQLESFNNCQTQVDHFSTKASKHAKDVLGLSADVGTTQQQLKDFASQIQRSEDTASLRATVSHLQEQMLQCIWEIGYLRGGANSLGSVNTTLIGKLILLTDSTSNQPLSETRKEVPKPFGPTRPIEGTSTPHPLSLQQSIIPPPPRPSAPGCFPTSRSALSYPATYGAPPIYYGSADAASPASVWANGHGR